MSEDLKNTSSPRDDALLIRAFQAGDKAAFDKLVLKHQHKLINLCYRFLGDYQEANDSAQETFIKVYRSLNRFRFESAFSTWLYRIAVNTCKNRLMSQDFRRSRKTVSIDDPIQTDEGEVQIEIKDESLSPEREVDAREKNELIQQAISSLPDDQKQVVILRDIEQLSYEEISQVTGLNIGTVKSKLSRARQALCDKLRRVI